MIHAMSGCRLLRPIAVALVLALAACASPTPTPYQPQTGRFGYTTEQLDNGSWRVQFTGNPLTPRDTIEDYALYRAAQLAQQQGFERFAVMDRTYDTHTERTYAYQTRPPGFESREQRLRGVTTYSDPFESTRMVTNEWRTATLVIRPVRGAAPAGTHHVYDAAAEIARIGPTLKRH
jgi:hypothetical protein